MSKIGHLNIILNAHLPFVRHPEEESFRQENWLFDALSETYLPFLRMLKSLELDGIRFKLTLSISPTLEAMLADELIQQQYMQRLEELLGLADKELKRTSGRQNLQDLARMYRELIQNNLEDYEGYGRNILNPMREFQKKGYLEIITTTATHCYLPLYQHFPQVINSQLRTALELHEHYFAQIPKGIWLPECGYYPGLEEALKESGIEYFICSANSVRNAVPAPASGLYHPVRCQNGVTAFPLERTAFKALYSPVEGYPAGALYRDFFRDIGFELSSDYVAPYMRSDIGRINTGFKYFAKSLEGEEERVYDSQTALAQAENDARSFAKSISKQCHLLKTLMEKEEALPLLSCAYDAELFGHWWFEGLHFLQTFIRTLAEEGQVDFVSPEDYSSHFDKFNKTNLALGSWADNGYNQALLDSSNDWIYRHTNSTVEIMTDLANRYPDEKGLLERTLNQAARETLLSLASDWPFILNTGTATSYAKRRLKSHIYNVNYISDSLSRKKVKADWLTKLEKRNNIFPDIDYRLFKTK